MIDSNAGNIVISANNGLSSIITKGTLRPLTDNTNDLGISTRRYQDLFLAGTIYGGSTLTLDPAAHGDDTGTVVIAGNLQVDGTTTTINSTTLTVDDKNITLASGAANAAAANGAGLTVDCGSDTDATLTYVSSTDSWDFNKKVKFDTVQGHGSNNFLIDSPAEIHLDSHSGFTRLRTQGGDIGLLQLTNNDLTIRSMVSDRDIIFQGYDGSTNITALTLDMSNAGAATFNSSITVTGTNANLTLGATGNNITELAEMVYSILRHKRVQAQTLL